MGKILSETKKRHYLTKQAAKSLLLASLIALMMFCVPVYAASATELLEKARNLLGSALVASGVFSAVLGFLHIGRGLPQHDSQGIQQGILQFFGGALIAAGGLIVYSIDVKLSDAPMATAALDIVDYLKL